MRKIILMFLVFTVFNSFAQTTNSILNKNNEVRLGVVKLLAGTIVEGSYEYAFRSDMGVGLHLLINLDKQSNTYQEDLSLTPYFRMYFQKTEQYGAKGFFVEGFTSFFKGDNIKSEGYYDENEGFVDVKKIEEFFDISLGALVGKKWITNSGFVFEARAGAGRNLLDNSDYKGLFKGDLSIGYRF